jgi:hypothetical protein
MVCCFCCSHGPFENYGEMLYAEGVEAAAVKNSRVSVHFVEAAAVSRV